MQPVEHFAHRARQAFIQSEAAARPIDAGAHLAHLVEDRAAGLFFPLPNPRNKLLAPQILAANAFLCQIALHNHLRCDAGMVHTRQPEGVEAAHPVPPDRHIDQRVLQHVAHVERSGDVGRRNHQGKHGLGGVGIGGETAMLHPPLSPARFEPARLVHFLNLHGNLQDNP